MARCDSFLVAEINQRQGMLLRGIGLLILSGGEALQIFCQRLTLANRIDARLRPRVPFDGGGIASSEDEIMAG